ncbi:hypothetical protein [Candidatus Poriferisodalis sp.]|uniref:hypothetical protein n=1 Tax=Candidatus Poriferisodalis sp. TaxID=3101277 RepID=UPI003B02CC74
MNLVQLPIRIIDFLLASLFPQLVVGQPCCCILELSLASLLPQPFLLLCFAASDRFLSVPFLLLYF